MLGEISGLMAALYGLFGLIIGSFLNVCIDRIPLGESVAAGRSHCPDCGHVLSPLDLVPVISYLALGRRCRYCHQPIPAHYATVESLTGLLFATSGFAWTRIGLEHNFPLKILLLAPLCAVALLSLLFVRAAIRLNRRQAGSDTRLWPLPAGVLLFSAAQVALAFLF